MELIQFDGSANSATNPLAWPVSTVWMTRNNWLGFGGTRVPFLSPFHVVTPAGNTRTPFHPFLTHEMMGRKVVNHTGIMLWAESMFISLVPVAGSCPHCHITRLTSLWYTITRHIISYDTQENTNHHCMLHVQSVMNSLDRAPLTSVAHSEQAT